MEYFKGKKGGGRRIQPLSNYLAVSIEEKFEASGIASVFVRPCQLNKTHCSGREEAGLPFYSLSGLLRPVELRGTSFDVLGACKVAMVEQVHCHLAKLGSDVAPKGSYLALLHFNP